MANWKQLLSHLYLCCFVIPTNNSEGSYLTSASLLFYIKVLTDSLLSEVVIEARSRGEAQKAILWLLQTFPSVRLLIAAC